MREDRSLIIRWFVPSELEADAENRRQAIRSVLFGLAMVVWAPVFAPIYQLLGSPRGTLVIALTAVAILASMLSLRLTKSVLLTGNLIAGVVFVCLMALACLTGGIEAASLWWLASVPIIGLILCGFGSGVFWAVVSCIACTVFMVLAEFGVAVPDDIGAENRHLLDWAAACGIVLCASTLTLTFKLGEAAARRDLEAARDASELANRAKSEFLTNMSHEIRTPMNAILGMTNLVLDSPLSPEQREYLTTVSESGETLLEVLNEILDFSRIEAGKLLLQTRVFALHESLGDTIKSLGVRAHKKGIELLLRIRPEVPQMIVGDSVRLRQLVINLVGNAIKFTEQGEVILDVDCKARENGQATLHFAVSDTGIGISADKQQIIFRAFEQADGSTTRRFGGTGLGLAICSRLTKLMRGRIWVESQPAKGSTFHFTVECRVADGELPGPQGLQPERLRGVRVLVVDDNSTNRGLLKENLDTWHMIPDCASGAGEALEMIDRAIEKSNPYRLILTDSQMPQTDGFRLAEQLRHDRATPGTVIMMLTSSDHSGDAERCESLGIAHYLRKPVKQSELFEAIAGTLGPSAPADGRREPRVSGHVTGLAPLKILLAEDSLVNQKLVVGLLEKYGNTIKVACNGREALGALDRERFDLVLMDVQMPEMDGFEATAEIRRREQATGEHVPIIALTAHAMKEDRRRCIDAGMDEYVSKPVRIEQLLDTIALLLKGTVEPKSTAPPPTKSDATMVDWEEAVSCVNGDDNLLRTLVEAVLQEVPNMLDSVRRAVRDRDENSLRVAAHTLKGAVRYFGVNNIFDRAFQLERMGRDGYLDGAEPVAENLSRDVQHLIRELNDYIDERDRV